MMRLDEIGKGDGRWEMGRWEGGFLLFAYSKTIIKYIDRIQE
jgi:hypothetical protein